MTNEEYRELALRTAPRAENIHIEAKHENLLLAVIGLAGEVGEILEHVKKHIFHGHQLDPDKLLKEMGDVEWYANLLREYFGFTLEQVHAANIAKLAARYPEGFFSSARSLHRAEGDE